jgi:hypothetical protein
MMGKTPSRGLRRRRATGGRCRSGGWQHQWLARRSARCYRGARCRTARGDGEGGSRSRRRQDGPCHQGDRRGSCVRQTHETPYLCYSLLLRNDSFSLGSGFMRRVCRLVAAMCPIGHQRHAARYPTSYPIGRPDHCEMAVIWLRPRCVAGGWLGGKGVGASYSDCELANTIRSL